MANHTPGPWKVSGHTQNVCAVNSPLNAGDIICQAPRGFVASLVYWEANARLIARAPSMLALLEKAYPIIEEEAERRDMAMQGDSDRIYTAGDYWTEMRQLADAISAEIDQAKGLRVEHSDAEQCPHGYGFSEYCEDCNQKEIKAKWREKEDSPG